MNGFQTTITVLDEIMYGKHDAVGYNFALSLLLSTIILKVKMFSVIRAIVYDKYLNWIQSSNWGRSNKINGISVFD